MKKSTIILLQCVVGCLPIIYLMSVWASLPPTIPVHFNTNLKVDRLGNRSELITMSLLLFVVSIGVSLLILNLNRLDPKQRYNNNNASATIRISWVLVVFMSLISGFIIYYTSHYDGGKNGGLSQKSLAILISLLFIFLGNFMNNLKPNYFVGVRTPWALEDSGNWKKTHHLASRIWFFGGLTILLLILFLPSSYSFYVLIIGIFPLAIIPIYYSYLLYRRTGRNPE